MTPAINFLKKHKVLFKVHEYQLIQPTANYGQDVADALGVCHQRLFKTLVVSLNNDAKKLAVCIVPVAGTLNLKLAAKALKAKKVEMADPIIAERVTGYVVGGISPFGQKRALPTVIDEQATAVETLYASAGKRGLQVEVTPSDLITTLNATAASITSVE